MEGLDILDKIDINKKMLGRKSRGEKARWYIIYPDDKLRKWWDLLITL